MTQKPLPPKRARIPTELGRLQTLPEGDGAYAFFGKGPRLLVIGLGPDPRALAFARDFEDAGISYLECPGVLARIQPPESWKRIFSLPAWLAENGCGRIAFYTPGLRFFPSFYAPLWAMLQLKDAPAPGFREKTVLLPGDEGTLLTREVAQAFQTLGFQAAPLPAAADPPRLARLLREWAPALFFSINFRGLDDYGEAWHLLRAAQVPVAVWCVDNPWHLVSRLRSPFWKECPLFVTDPAFVPGLKAAGAKNARFLPLAAGQHFFYLPDARPGVPLQPLVFVGRSAFPNKAGFFAGLALNDAEHEEIRQALLHGERRDFFYWESRRLDAGGQPQDLWPGSRARQTGFLAEESSRAWRRLCLAAACETGISVFGDSGFADIVPEADLHPPVDYYGQLPRLYAAARYSLALTSLLLPKGLNQRHFDVWAAGGMLVSDNTPGLALFPPRLTEEIVFRAPGELPGLINRLERDATLRQDLKKAWRQEILASHTYEARLASLLDALSL